MEGRENYKPKKKLPKITTEEISLGQNSILDQFSYSFIVFGNVGMGCKN